MTIFGWDMSDFDYDRGARPAHIQNAKNEGIKFLTHKSTEQSSGNVFKHTRMGLQLNAAKAVGIPFIGHYIVVRSNVPPATQVTTCLAFLDQQVPWWRTYPGWFHQVDLEKWPYDAVSPILGEAVAAELERRTGKKAILYASRGQYGNSIPNTGRVLWNANYGNNPAAHFKPLYPGDTGAGWVTYSGRMPRIWQYGSRAIIGGQSTCDANAFRGTEADFATMIGGSAAPSQPSPPKEASNVDHAERVDYVLEKGKRPEPNQTMAGGIPINWLVRQFYELNLKLDRVNTKLEAIEALLKPPVV